MNNITYRGYTAQMNFDTEDKILVGRVVDIDGIITFHGTAVAEFESAFKTAVGATSMPVSSSGKPLTSPLAAG